MEALYVQTLTDDGVFVREEGEKRGKQEVEGTQALSASGSSTDEETDEDSEPEPEPPPFVRRKVSFADAFGLNLVSVKEFDNVEVAELPVIEPPETEAGLALEEFYISCLFTVPSSQEELDQKLKTQMVELESFQFLPGTTTLRGIIRVVNLCYNKSVYARISLDRWKSYFDLLAEYVPGSSDRKTDRFTFRYTLIPPFAKEGTRVDFCLRYETSLGTFWANNNKMNYVLFCHQKAQVKEQGSVGFEEIISHRSKRSCLKANRRGSAEEQAKETSSTTVSTEAPNLYKDEETDEKATVSSQISSSNDLKNRRTSVDNVKGWQRTPRLIRVQDRSLQNGQVPLAYSHDSASGQKVSQPTPTPWCHPASIPFSLHKKANNSQQVLTYHQIPLLTLDYNDKQDIWDKDAKTKFKENTEDNQSVSDLWESFLKGTDAANEQEPSVLEVWQSFLSEPSCKDHSTVPESEWLQSATSVSPSNPNITSSVAFPGLQVEKDAPALVQAETSAACHPLSDKCRASLSKVVLNTEAQLPAGARVSRARDDNAGTQDASQRSQTNSLTDTLQEFSPEGATAVSRGGVDSSAERQERAFWEQVGEGIIRAAEGAGEDEPVRVHTADLVTSSGEWKTTDMTAMPESQNASTVDVISQRARPGEGLSSSGDEEGTGTAHNTPADTLAFRETIRQGTKSREGFVFSTSRQRAEENIMTKCMENEVCAGETIFSLPCEEERDSRGSQRYANDTQGEEFIPVQKKGNPLLENEGGVNGTGTAHEFNPNQTCEENIRASRVMRSEFQLRETENRDMASGNKDLERVGAEQVENSYCTKPDSKRLISAESEMTPLAAEAQRRAQRGDTSMNPPAQGKHSRSIRAEVEEPTQTEGIEPATKAGDIDLVSNMTEVSESLINCGTNEEEQENSAIFSTALEVVEKTEESPQGVMKGQGEHTGSHITRKEVLANSGRDASNLDKSQSHDDEKMGDAEMRAEGAWEMKAPECEMREASAELEEQGLTPDVENVFPVEHKKHPEGTKVPILAGKTVKPKVSELKSEAEMVERFGEDLLRRIWEEVFGPKAMRSKQAAENSSDTIMTETDIEPKVAEWKVKMLVERFSEEIVRRIWDEVFSHTCNLHFEQHAKSDRLSENDQHQRLCQHLEQTQVTDKSSSKKSSQSLTKLNQTKVVSELPTDFKSKANLSPDCLFPTWNKLAQSHGSPKNPGTCGIHRRSRSCQETVRHPGLSSEELTGSHGLVRWSMFVLSQTAKLLACILFVVGFFVILSYYDFTTFCAAYLFSLVCWCYKWKRLREPMNKDVGGEFSEEKDVLGCNG